MNKLKSLANINYPETEWSYFCQKTTCQEIAKGDYFFRPDRICDQLGFVSEGLLRSYVTQNGKEFNIEFYAEGQFVSAFTSFLTQKPSDWVIQALENCEIVVISHKLLNELYQRHPCWLELGKKIFEYQTLKKCQREKSLLRDQATARYELFREEYREIEHRLPLFHIASYLGIEPETLSRLRKKYFLDLHQGN